MRIPLTTYCQTRWWTSIEKGVRRGVELPRSNLSSNSSARGETQSVWGRKQWPSVGRVHEKSSLREKLGLMGSVVSPSSDMPRFPLLPPHHLSRRPILHGEKNKTKKTKKAVHFHFIEILPMFVHLSQLICVYLLTSCLSGHQNRVCSHTYGPSKSKAGMQ